MKCAQCGKAAKHRTPTGRGLCDAHYRELAGYAGAGTAMLDGASAPIAVGTGIAAQGYTGTLDAEARRQRELAQRPADEPSFWARLKLRMIG